MRVAYAERRCLWIGAGMREGGEGGGGMGGWLEAGGVGAALGDFVERDACGYACVE
jgi:hypothetical protein